MVRAQPSQEELSERDRQILREVILSYIVEAEPVSSRSVAKRSDLGLSAATIRNAMADLEEAGFLSQPHTSAGRVPTAAAYHLFIEQMLAGSGAATGVPAKVRRYIRDHLRAAPGDAEDLMEVTTHLLSDLSRQMGIVVTPVMGDTVLKAVDFVPLSGRKVLCVVVSTSGFVDNKVVETDVVLDRETLIQITNYVNERYAGQTLRQIRDRLLAQMAEERAQMDRLLALTIELARTGFDFDEGPKVYHEGTTSLLQQPELADLQRVHRLFDTFANNARLVRMLNQCIQGSGVRVTIGEESPLTSELDFSLVATTYGVDDEPLGTLGIFGPSRMEYQKVIPLVHYLGETLSVALAEVYGRER
jgi:heat-inducible transcriptional repressor